jgi:hypothetical protein
MTRDELRTYLIQSVKGTRTKIDNDDIENAVNDATAELGWSLPVTSDFQTFWMKRRSLYHLLFFLYVESAHKFKFEGINLQNRFQNYHKMLERMDQQFENAMQADPAQFAGVNKIHTLGTKIDSGFSYGQYGHETTYSDDNKVILEPNDDSQ